MLFVYFFFLVELFPLAYALLYLWVKLVFFKKKLGCVMYLVLFFYRRLRLIILIYSRKLTGGPWE